MNIGEAAKRSGVNAKMIRHYEEIGIIPKAARSNAGYRMYTSADIHTLVFVKRARGLGFGMKEIKKLVGLWRNKRRSSLEVKTLAFQHIHGLEQKILEMKQMVDALKSFASGCHGDHRPECPIIDELSKEKIS